ncbi:uncharacterized protein PV09_06434 [Verruconis gallopava]|uniref:Spindle pole body component n=1 Tax=Verruconis gallopava TaxID=253628 RepID=A0A0D2AT04_9PEZI|nr:uncharacterized protein PV09_06434 [Verruconis gallopava]KIW02284.1 hypothetical protein PV09_06434 [Verruconis gallopava]
MDFDLHEGAFQPRNPWRLYLGQFEGPPSQPVGVNFNVDVDSEDNPFISNAVAPEELKLPELRHFEYGVLDDLPPLEESLATDDECKREDFLEPEDDKRHDIDSLWEPIVENQVTNETRLLSWEAFQSPGIQEPASAYLSEAGARAFDAALFVREKGCQPDKEIIVIRNDVFLQSMFSLGLGRSSALFRYNPKSKQFELTDSHHNVSGMSKELTSSAVAKMGHCGRLVRHLRSFVDRTYASSKAYPAKVALANTIATVVDALESQLASESRNIASVLQLLDKFDRPHRMLTEVYDLARGVGNARSNEELASMVFKRCQHCDQEPDWLRAMMLEVLARVSRPWLELVERWVGFMGDLGLRNGVEDDTFITQEANFESDKEKNVAQELRYSFNAKRLPLFVTPEDGQIMFDIGRDVRILRAHQPKHPLAQTRVAERSDITLQWQFDWQHVEQVAAKAKEFEAALAEAVQHFEQSEPTSSKVESRATAVDETRRNEEECFDPFVLRDVDYGYERSVMSVRQPDALSDLIGKNLRGEQTQSDDALVDFSPPIAITPVLSFSPLLAAQQRILNAVMLRLFFRTHDLRLHLDLQRSFHLLGDGVFAARLAAALFDPDQSSTERQRGVMRSGTSMGLRLGSRRAWPPASSELRLALMGILSDCFRAAFPRRASTSSELPGALSFAIRQLSEEEADCILDPDSLHALDFLRLQYAAPSPLGAVLTPAALERYDSVFRFLLRLVRMLFVVSRLAKAPATAASSSSSRARFFRWRAETFVSACCRYFFDTGVRETWAAFVRYLDDLERQLRDEDEAGQLGSRVREGIEDVRRQHDLCLDRIAFALLLRNRQQKVMALLEEIFGSVLEFAKLCRDGDGDGAGGARIDDTRVDELYAKFDAKVALFLEVCRGLVGKKGYGKSSGDGRRGFGGDGVASEENTIERLVVALDFNGYHERRAR